MEEIKRKVREWWNSSPCGTRDAPLEPGTREFYEKVNSNKDRCEPFVNEIADYKAWSGKRILEVGCGVGKDFSRFVSAGAIATAVDLSEESLKLTAKRLRIFDLKGDLCLADAENLPFRGNAFDLVFSWGVLHHTPNTQKAIDEIYSCVKTGGRVIIMLYNRHSLFSLEIFIISVFGLNFLRKLKRILSPWRWFKPMEARYEGWERLNRSQLLATFTDGLGNPFSRVFGRAQAARMMAAFKDVEIRAYESVKSPFMRIFRIFGFLEKRMGFFLVIKARK